MKKSLIALAALAATSASFAQSSVTLSGTVDVGVEKRWSGDAYRLTPNTNGTSNWTLSGKEDLGGGLNAVFQVSTSFNADNGTTGNTESTNTGAVLGNNGMFVGLTGGFGTLRAGRPVHILWGNTQTAIGTKGVSGHSAAAVLDSISNVGTLGPRGTQFTAPGGTTPTAAGYGVYAPNAIQYLSPSFGGLQVQLEFAPAENAGSQNNDGVGIAVRFDSGPLSLSAVNYKAASNQTLTAENKAVTQLAGAYDFGLAKVLFTYRDQSGAASNDDTAYALGVTAPVGPGLAYFSYNVAEQGATADGKTILFGYKYNLSKRTQAYVNVANRNKTWANAAVVAGGGKANKSSTGFGLGLQHNF